MSQYEPTSTLHTGHDIVYLPKTTKESEVNTFLRRFDIVILLKQFKVVCFREIVVGEGGDTLSLE